MRLRRINQPAKCQASFTFFIKSKKKDETGNGIIVFS